MKCRGGANFARRERVRLCVGRFQRVVISVMPVLPLLIFFDVKRRDNSLVKRF